MNATIQSMKQIPFVRVEHHDIAMDIENRLISLPPDSGITFVSATAQPVLQMEDLPHISVVVGCKRSMDAKAVKILSGMMVSKELSAGIDVKIEVRRGESRS